MSLKVTKTLMKSNQCIGNTLTSPRFLCVKIIPFILNWVKNRNNEHFRMSLWFMSLVGCTMYNFLRNHISHLMMCLCKNLDACKRRINSLCLSGARTKNHTNGSKTRITQKIFCRKPSFKYISTESCIRFYVVHIM